MEELEAEKAAREEAKVRHLGEKLPPLQLTGLTLDDLQVSHRNLSEEVKHSVQECHVLVPKQNVVICFVETL